MDLGNYFNFTGSVPDLDSRSTTYTRSVEREKGSSNKHIKY